LDERQQHIANLARELLPFLERGEKKSKLIRSLNQGLLLILFTFFMWHAHEDMRPINASEEHSLKILLEYAAQKLSIPTNERTQKFLEHHRIKDLGDLPAYKWERAMLCISKKLN
jgi:hypothetical protein